MSVAHFWLQLLSSSGVRGYTHFWLWLLWSSDVRCCTHFWLGLLQPSVTCDDWWAHFSLGLLQSSVVTSVPCFWPRNASVISDDCVHFSGRECFSYQWWLCPFFSGQECFSHQWWLCPFFWPGMLQSSVMTVSFFLARNASVISGDCVLISGQECFSHQWLMCPFFGQECFSHEWWLVRTFSSSFLWPGMLQSSVRCKAVCSWDISPLPHSQDGSPCTIHAVIGKTWFNNHGWIISEIETGHCPPFCCNWSTGPTGSVTGGFVRWCIGRLSGLFGPVTSGMWDRALWLVQSQVGLWDGALAAHLL